MTLARRLIALIVILFLVPMPGAGAAGNDTHVRAFGVAGATDVHGDDEQDRFVGTGGLILPGSVDSSVRQEVADCGGCRWRLTVPCAHADLGTPFGGGAVCLSVVRGCPSMRTLLRAWFAPAGGSWREVGLVCIGSEGPLTVQRAAAQATGRIHDELVPLRAATQPPVGAIAQIPVHFDSMQERGPLAFDHVVAGEAVRIVATPSWRWTFGDGTALETADPGGAFPDGAVRHAYRSAGSYVVEVTSTWWGTFTVGGLGPFPVPEPVRQESRILLVIGEGRAVLAVH